MTDTQRQLRSLDTAMSYRQGNIEGLDDVMTRRLVASAVYTESNGGDLAITNSLGYIGRYQAGAGWLADAGLVDKEKLRRVSADFKSETAWARSGGMTAFLSDDHNWKEGLSLGKYMASGDLQDLAFKRNCDAAFARAIKQHVLQTDDPPAHIAGFLKARHIAGYGGAAAVVTGGVTRRDDNQTSNYDYYNDVAKNRDGLDKLMAVASLNQASPLETGSQKRSTPSHQERKLLPDRDENRIEQVRQLQGALAELGYIDGYGHAVAIDGQLGPHTLHALKSFQRAHHLHVDGIVGKHTLAALEDAKRWPLLSEATHPQHRLYAQVELGIRKLPHHAHGSEREIQNSAVALTIAAHTSGLQRVDHVVLGTNGVNLFAVQGQMDDPGHRRVHVEFSHAMAQAVDHRAISTLQPVPAHALAAVQQATHGGPMMMGR